MRFRKKHEKDDQNGREIKEMMKRRNGIKEIMKIERNKRGDKKKWVKWTKNDERRNG
jgi:hypothetical protein